MTIQSVFRESRGHSAFLGQLDWWLNAGTKDMMLLNLCSKGNTSVTRNAPGLYPGMLGVGYMLNINPYTVLSP